MEADASKFAGGAMLSQVRADGVQRPIAFWSRQWTSAEQGYPTRDHKLLAIVCGFKEWRHHLCDALHKVHVYSDHESLKYFATAQLLNNRQRNWASILSDFRYEIHHRPSANNPHADALSRRPDYVPLLGLGSEVLVDPQLLSQDLFANALGFLPLELAPLVLVEDARPLLARLRDAQADNCDIVWIETE